VTASGKEPAEPQSLKPRVPQSRPSEEDLAELWEPPDDLPVPEYPDRWLPGQIGRRPEYVIVVDQLRPRQPGQSPSLAELLESLRSRTRDPEPDLEAEP
jgi:hypothetical protein